MTFVRLFFALACALLALRSEAVPSFARQTGLECVNCHLSWPELTSVGRQFKLGGYTLINTTSTEERPVVSLRGTSEGPPPILPLAAMVQVSLSRTKNRGDADPSLFPHDNDLVLQQASLFYSGRIVDHVGVFSQWTYDGIEHHSSVDNVDLRYAHALKLAGSDVAFGLTLNNNPTVSDIYNTTPAWGFPFASSAVAVTPNAATVIDGGLAQQVAGLGAYALWNRTVYAEVAAYRTADGVFSLLRAGTDRTTDAVLDGASPYWRLALQHEWDEGRHSAMIGTYGMDVRKFPDPTDPSGPTDRFRDVGLDAQYQYIGDRHRISGQINWIRERQDLDGTFGSGGSENASNTLYSLRGKLTWYLDAKYGATVGWFRVSGNGDNGLYNTGDPVTGSINGSPNSSGYVLEGNWLPKRDVRLSLQYTAYRTFNGASSNYDGFGRNAHDNDTLFLIGWFMF
jgi:hypothetical protein